jgi:hypothetical protein
MAIDIKNKCDGMKKVAKTQKLLGDDRQKNINLIKLTFIVQDLQLLETVEKKFEISNPNI